MLRMGTTYYMNTFGSLVYSKVINKNAAETSVT
jgi:hypothetical protein